MSLSRLLLRSIRRYSSSTSTPFPLPFPFDSTTTTASDPSTPFPNQAPTNPQYPNPSAAAAGNSQPPFQSAHSNIPDTSNYHYNNQFQASTPNYQHNPQFPPTNNFQPPFSSAGNTAAAAGTNYNYNYNPQFSNTGFQSPISTPSISAAAHTPFNSNNDGTTSAAPFIPQRSVGFSSAEEAAAERRRRKRRLRIEPPLGALRPNPQTPSSNAYDPDKPRLADSTSALVGNRLNLHNRVQSLIRAGDLDAASYIARQSVFQSVRPTVFTCNAIIAAMYRAKRYSDAKALFQYFFRQFNIIPNIVSYNNLIVSHCESNEIEDALEVYKDILANSPYSPSSVTYRHLTKGLIDAGRIDDAVSMLREMLNKGHGADSLVYNNVILGFLNLGKLEKANELFDELKERCTVYDGVVNATFMDWFFNQGRPKEAMESYRDLMERNYRMVPATRNVLLETLLKHGKKKEAWDLFHDMLDDHTPPTFQAVNSDTVNMMVNECFKEGKVDEAMDVFKRSGKGIKSKPFQMDVAGFNNMMSRMSELEMMDEAEQYYKQLCDKSLSPDVNTYKTLIDAYIKVERVDNMIEKYTKMVEAGLRVIPPYANKWFGFLIEKGKASDCVPILLKMADREPKPDVTTYDIVIRGLVEVGNYDAVANLLREMMNHYIGIIASLKEFVLDAFEKQGRRSEVENILNSFQSQQRPYPRPRVPSANNWGGGDYPPTSYSTQYNDQTAQTPVANFGTAASSYPHTSYVNQYREQTPQPPMNFGNAASNYHQTSYANHQTSYANQYMGQTAQPPMTNSGMPSSIYPQASFANQYTEQAPQQPEQETEFRQVARV